MAKTFLHEYSDIPEGTECHRKAYASTSIGGATGLIISAYSVALRPPASFLEGVARTGRYTFTAAAIGAIFGLTSCISAQVREKPDDPLNYFIGGCAGGLTLGARTSGWQGRKGGHTQINCTGQASWECSVEGSSGAEREVRWGEA
uniref:NADH dehydrogenase [ubiquinone] 1 alpha subcomplex subunit 11 n=1 Tax=Catagonus wagneri TaxID=51154 RepID=A0A8C3YLW8_9CETA